MKKSRLTILLAICAVTMFAAALAGCSTSFDPVKEGYTVTVTYNSDGGKYSNNDATGIKTFRYKPGSVIMEPGVTNSEFQRPTKEGYNVRYWYVCELDENGAPKQDENGKYVLSDTPWNFATDRTGEDNTNIYLVAHWSKNYLFTVDVGEAARADGVENLVFNNYSEPSKLSEPGVPPTWAGHTLLYYKTADGERISSFSNLYISDENPEITVYVEWLEGVWKIITTSHDFGDAIDSYGSYYLDDDIDFGVYNDRGEMTGKGPFLGAVNFEGRFEGNGHTIKNFSCVKEVRDTATTFAGLFSFRGEGYMRNVKFENCSVEVSLFRDQQDGYRVGFIAGRMTNAAALNNFAGLEFVNCELNITREGFAKENNVNVYVGEDGYKGVFGMIADGASFTVPADKLGITINIDNNKD